MALPENTNNLAFAPVLPRLSVTQVAKMAVLW